MKGLILWLAGGSIISMILWCLLGILLGAGAYTVYYGEGLSYLSSDPKACVNCHIMREQYDEWQKASHHAAASCVDCHLPHDPLGKWIAKAENGFWHSKGFTLQDFHEPIRIHNKNATILQANCVRCHQDFVHQITTIKPSESNTVHCVHCHNHVGHGPSR
ncbi:MAG: cytochrome c nitrite reductase small subunit [Planctomycetia bacterium]|nr:cytochrome c nitrite reductase small subunit [Planctomycetia bacterium]